MKQRNWSDSRGKHIRLYTDIFDSPAYRALSPHDVLAYLALRRELGATNNGDLSLPLSRAKHCGIKHHLTLARCLRALQAVGLIAITRKGGCQKNGQRLPTLFRFTDEETYENPRKFIAASKATNDWKQIANIAQGKHAIAQADAQALKPASHSETETLGHAVTGTTSRRDLKTASTTSPGDNSCDSLHHAVSLAKKPSNPIDTRGLDEFERSQKSTKPRTPDVPPLHDYHALGDAQGVKQEGSASERQPATIVEITAHKQRKPLEAICALAYLQNSPVAAPIVSGRLQ